MNNRKVSSKEQSEKDLTMHEAFINLNTVPTHVMAWGKWIEEDLSNEKLIILFIPGNPGLLGFYKAFLDTVYEQLGGKVPVWTVGHGGHEIPNSTLRPIPIFQSNKDLYDLNAQVNHKASFIRKYVPKDTKIIIMGHSIGAYICVELLNEPDIESKIQKSYLLFPTLEHMADTPQGKFLNKFVRYFVSILVFLTWCFITFLPSVVQTFLIKAYLFLTRSPVSFINEAKSFLKPNVVRNVLFMVMDEMEKVNDRNDSCIEKNLNKLKLYYGQTDHWAPPSYYYRIKEKHPTINAELCNFEHAFVMRNSEEVGKIVVGWIQEDFNI